MVAEYDAAAAGEKGAVLRREGLYSSHVTEWRRARDAGILAGPARPRGRPAADPRDAQIARLQKEKAKLEQELAKARFVVDVQANCRRRRSACRSASIVCRSARRGAAFGQPVSRTASRNPPCEPSPQRALRKSRSGFVPGPHAAPSGQGEGITDPR